MTSRPDHEYHLDSMIKEAEKIFNELHHILNQMDTHNASMSCMEPYEIKLHEVEKELEHLRSIKAKQGHTSI